MTEKSTAYAHIERIAKCKKYFKFGFSMLICNLLILFLYVDYFQVTTNDITSYIKDECLVTSIEVKTHTFNCMNGDYINYVDIPCVKILLKTVNLTNVLFFRNIQERLFAIKSGADCSYLPTACQQNSDYMLQYLKENMRLLFPRINQTFECYRIRKSIENYDAILYIPHPLMYYTSLVVNLLGIFISVLFVIYGALCSDLHIYMIKVFFNPTRKDEKILEKRRRDQDVIMKDQVQSFFHHIKYMLEDSNVEMDDFESNTYDSIILKERRNQLNPRRISCYDISKENIRKSSSTSSLQPSGSKMNLNQMVSKSLTTVVEAHVPERLNEHY